MGAAFEESVEAIVGRAIGWREEIAFVRRALRTLQMPDETDERALRMLREDALP